MRDANGVEAYLINHQCGGNDMITINSHTRQFSVPGADLTFGVTGDSNTEVKHFTCPRYVGDNLDVTSCFVRINYRNANGETDF